MRAPPLCCRCFNKCGEGEVLIQTRLKSWVNLEKKFSGDPQLTKSTPMLVANDGSVLHRPL